MSSRADLERDVLAIVSRYALNRSFVSLDAALDGDLGIDSLSLLSLIEDVEISCGCEIPLERLDSAALATPRMIVDLVSAIRFGAVDPR